MPITRSAKKALRGSLRKKVMNDRKKKNYREAIKKVEKLVKEKKVDEAKKLLPSAYQAIDKASKTGALDRNTASRRKSRLTRIVK
jgi:small subunit ribosomal protein S20